MKNIFAAALTAATLATPAMADDVFDCFILKLDAEIQTANINTPKPPPPKQEPGVVTSTSSSMIYPYRLKMEMIAACEVSTNQKSSGLAEELPFYFHNSGTDIFFMPN